MVPLEYTGKPAYDGRLLHCNRWRLAHAHAILDREAINAYFSDLQGRYAPSTVKLTRSAIRASLRLSGIPEGDLFSGIRIRARKARVKSANRYSESEIKKFVEKSPPRVSLLARFLYSRGVRIDGALGVRLCECRKEKQSVVVPIRSKGYEYEVRISDEFFVEICNTFRSRAWLFENRRGGRYTRQNFNMQFCKYGRQILGRSNFSPHKLKHSLCSNLLEAGYTVRQVADLTNTATATISEFYDLNQISETKLRSLERIA
ncbi:MAG TPA: tyrosine-type recombinase/integrase [Leptospiraceae bacterium]|nr:tyrosine-type recombinase/integrase [Leptospiraceae bacterium]HMW59982.1 tyrosine-type recombinase/integrase [Leptospiraceae bacterium]HNN76248.1 tyrosine-type recombinase/integrase [Leptospiraceae bacterium]